MGEGTAGVNPNQQFFDQYLNTIEGNGEVLNADNDGVVPVLAGEELETLATFFDGLLGEGSNFDAVTALDADGDGFISRDEFVEFMDALESSPEVFDGLDTNKDGVLTTADGLSEQEIQTLEQGGTVDGTVRLTETSEESLSSVLNDRAVGAVGNAEGTGVDRAPYNNDEQIGWIELMNSSGLSETDAKFIQKLVGDGNGFMTADELKQAQADGLINIDSDGKISLTDRGETVKVIYQQLEESGGGENTNSIEEAKTIAQEVEQRYFELDSPLVNADGDGDLVLTSADFGGGEAGDRAIAALEGEDGDGTVTMAEFAQASYFGEEIGLDGNEIGFDPGRAAYSALFARSDTDGSGTINPAKDDTSFTAEDVAEWDNPLTPNGTFGEMDLDEYIAYFEGGYSTTAENSNTAENVAMDDDSQVEGGAMGGMD